MIQPPARRASPAARRRPPRPRWNMRRRTPRRTGGPRCRRRPDSARSRRRGPTPAARAAASRWHRASATAAPTPAATPARGSASGASCPELYDAALTPEALDTGEQLLVPDTRPQQGVQRSQRVEAVQPAPEVEAVRSLVVTRTPLTTVTSSSRIRARRWRHPGAAAGSPPAIDLHRRHLVHRRRGQDVDHVQPRRRPVSDDRARRGTTSARAAARNSMVSTTCAAAYTPRRTGRTSPRRVRVARRAATLRAPWPGPP